MYFCRKNGKILGPFNVDKLRELAAREMIGRSSEISDDKINWKRADAFRELFPDDKKAKEQTAKENRTAVEDSPVDAPIRIKRPENFRDKEMPPICGDGKLPSAHIETDAGSPAGRCEKLNYFELLWNPGETLPVIYTESGDRKSAYIGIGMALLSAVSFFIGIKTTNEAASIGFFGLLLVVLVPFAGMIFASFITRTYLGSEPVSGGFGGDCLISGSAFLLLSLALLVTACMLKNQEFFLQKGLFISLALLIYAYTSTVLILYSGSTAISGIPRPVASVSVPLMIAVTAILSGLIFRYFMTAPQ